MIGYLNGTILETSPGRITLLVAQQSIGYSVQLAQSARALSLHPGQKLELFIYTHVREDALDLFGFFDLAEKSLFLSLTSVNGIGPKLGLTLLSYLSGSELTAAIVSGRKETLVAIPGVGKKTAERIILELQDKFKKAGFSGSVAASNSSAVPYAPVQSEAQAVLASLGYKPTDIERVLDQVMKQNPGLSDVETIIQQSLKLMSRKSTKGIERESNA